MWGNLGANSSFQLLHSQTWGGEKDKKCLKRGSLPGLSGQQSSICPCAGDTQLQLIAGFAEDWGPCLPAQAAAVQRAARAPQLPGTYQHSEVRAAFAQATH